MSDSLATHVDKPYNMQPETREKAIRNLKRLGAEDLIEMLGLDQPRELQPLSAPRAGYKTGA